MTSDATPDLPASQDAPPTHDSSATPDLPATPNSRLADDAPPTHDASSTHDASPTHDARTNYGADRLSDGFSLLLPVYAGDDPEHFRLAFESSVHEQTLPPNEVIIVRDGPVPEALAAELRRVTRESPVPVDISMFAENRGLTEALTVGLMAASYEVVARMDADDVSMPDRFERQWALIEDGFDLVGTGMVEFESDPSVHGARRVPPTGSERIREHARTHNPFNHPTMMYRVDAVERVGGYEPFGKMEDYWLGVRMIDSGARVENIADPLVAYRVGSGVFQRRGGWREVKTEWRLQREMRHIGFITRTEYVRNVVVKGAYRLLPAWAKKVLFRRFVGGGLPGD